MAAGRSPSRERADHPVVLIKQGRAGRALFGSTYFPVGDLPGRICIESQADIFAYQRMVLDGHLPGTAQGMVNTGSLLGNGIRSVPSRIKRLVRRRRQLIKCHQGIIQATLCRRDKRSPRYATRIGRKFFTTSPRFVVEQKQRLGGHFC